MNRASHLRVFVYLIVAVQLCGCATGQAADKYGRRSDHPYLTYSDANIEKLKERIANEPMIAKAWERMLANAERVVEPSDDRGGRGRRRRR